MVLVITLMVGLVGLSPAGSVTGTRQVEAGRTASDVRLRPTTDGAEDAFTVPADQRHQVDTPHFRIHFTTEGADTAARAYVKGVATVLEEVWRAEVDVLGWQVPRDDGDIGGRATDGRALVDVYLLDLDDGPYGYAAADEENDCRVCTSVFGYLVIENDFVGYAPGPEAALRSTAAHEFGHLIQMGMAWTAEPWAYEATAVWLEQAVYPEDDARTPYLADFADHPDLSLTNFSISDGGFDRSYGAYVWNLFLADAYGPDIIRLAWEEAAARDAHIMGGFARILPQFGTSLDEAFVAFTAATAAWEVGGFPGEPTAYPALVRQPTLASGDVVQVTVDHAAAYVVDLDVSDTTTVTVRGPLHVAGGVGVVASGAGQVTSAIDPTLFDGQGTVTLSGVGGAGRVTLVVVNADAALARPKRDGSDAADYLNDNVTVVIGVDVDPGLPPKE